MTDKDKVDGVETGLPKVWPEGYKLLVEVDEVEGQTVGGIILPHMVRETEQMKLTMGTVLRIGPKADATFADGKELRVGSRVVFARYGGHRLREVETKRDLRVLNDEDILVLLEDEWQ